MLKRPLERADVHLEMRVRLETMLNLMIVLIIAVDAFAALQVYQQRAEIPEPLLPAFAVGEGTPASAGSSGTAESAPSSTGRSAVKVTADVAARHEVQSAVLAAQLAFVDTGAMPADSFALQAAVPGVRFVDGTARAALGVIGVERTDTTILLVTAESDDRWICATVDGAAQHTEYGTGSSRAAVSDFSSCRGSQDGWG